MKLLPMNIALLIGLMLCFTSYLVQASHGPTHTHEQGIIFNSIKAQKIANQRILHSLENQTKALDLSGLIGLKELPANIRSLPQLQRINLVNTSITDISVLTHLKQLKSIDISLSAIKDISALKNLNKLAELDISNSKVRDLSPLEHLINLKALYLVNVQTTNFSMLAGLNKLQTLDLRYTHFKNLSILVNFKDLRNINISHSTVASLKQLSKLPN